MSSVLSRAGLILAAAILVSAIAPPANAQRVFRASSIDIEQNERIDAIEAKVSRIESSVASLVAAIEKQAKPASIAAQPATVTRVSFEPQPASTQSPAIRQQSSPSGYYSQAELIAIVQAAYPDGNYTRYADVSPRSGVWRHLQDGNHGFRPEQVEGLPQGIALGLHGLHHAGKIRATKTASAASVQVAYSEPAIRQTHSEPAIRQAYAQPVIQAAGGCANGQCARPAYATGRNRSFGLFRR